MLVSRDRPFRCLLVESGPTLSTASVLVTGMSVTGGLALSRGVCNHPSLETLRGI